MVQNPGGFLPGTIILDVCSYRKTAVFSYRGFILCPPYLFEQLFCRYLSTFDVSYTGFRPKAAFLLLEKVCVVVVIVVRVIF